MKHLHKFCLLIIFLIPSAAISQAKYGSNNDAGAYIQVNDIELYYEIYGKGEPLLLVHPNGMSIATMVKQITHFQKSYQVIAVDSRGHGKSGLGEGQLTYRKIARDIGALVSNLSLSDVRVIGWSDGAIVGLILGSEYPEMFSKMALMAPNTRPGDGAIISGLVEASERKLKFIEEMIAAEDQSKDWALSRQQLMLTLFQPDISPKELSGIQTPLLIIAGDRDLISNAHTVEIFESLPNAHLAILPNETHFTPVTNPTLFNSLVDDFFETTFHRSTSVEVFGQLNKIKPQQ